MSTGRTNLGKVGYTGASAYFHNAHRDLFAPRQWSAIAAHIAEWFDISSDQTSHSRGSQTVFQIDRRADRLGDISLYWTRAALAQTTGADTQAYFADWEGCHSIDNVQFLYNSKVVFRITGEQIYEDMINELEPNERAAWGILSLGDKSVQDRQDLAYAEQTVWANLRVPWRKIDKFLPKYGIPNKLRVEVNWQTKARVLHEPRSGDNTGGGISSPTLRCEFQHIGERHRDKVFDDVHSNKGYMIKFRDTESHLREAVTTTASSATGNNRTFSLRLTNLRNACYVLSAKLRYQHSVDNTTLLDPSQELPIVSMTMKDNGTDITKPAVGLPCASFESTTSYNLYKENIEAYPDAQPGRPIPRFFFCPPRFTMDSENNCYGSRDFYKYNNPTLDIVYQEDLHFHDPYPVPVQTPAASLPSTPYPMYVDVVSYIHNILIVHKGDVRKYLL